MFGEAMSSSDRVPRSSPHTEQGHFLLTIESFSLLLESRINKYESDEFEADGFNWRLNVYPKGDTKRNGSDHVSLYISVSDSKEFYPGWAMDVNFSLYVYNNISGEYLTCQGTSASETTSKSARRFHSLRTEWGFPKFIALDKFKDTSNGYLLDDTCVFGAEVSVIRFTVAKRGCLSVMKETEKKIFKWNITKFSSKLDEYLTSNKFQYRELEWNIVLYPKGAHKGKYISVFLEVAMLQEDLKTYVEFVLRVKNQVNTNHAEYQGEEWFVDLQQCGCFDLVQLTELINESNGYIVNDCIIVEAEIIVAAVTKRFN